MKQVDPIDQKSPLAQIMTRCPMPLREPTLNHIYVAIRDMASLSHIDLASVALLL